MKKRGELDLVRQAMADWIHKRNAAAHHGRVEHKVTTSGGLGLLRRSLVEWCSQTTELRTHSKVEKKVTSAGGAALLRRAIANWCAWSVHCRRLRQLKVLLRKRFDCTRMSAVFKRWYPLLVGSDQKRALNRAVANAQQARSRRCVAAAIAEWNMQATEGLARDRKSTRAVRVRRQRTLR
eukprot:3137726-Rhodomonas_salina.1